MNIFKTLFFVAISLVGMFFAWSFGVITGASAAMDDPELGKAAKKSLEDMGLSSDYINRKERRSRKKYKNYATLNEVLRGRDEFYDDVETE